MAILQNSNHDPETCSPASQEPCRHSNTSRPGSYRPRGNEYRVKPGPASLPYGLPRKARSWPIDILFYSVAHTPTTGLQT